MTTSETGERGGFTLLEILLVLALFGWIFIGGSSAMLSDRSSSPDDQFWSACAAARKAALEEQHTVLLGYDPKARAFTVNDGAQVSEVPVTGPEDLVIDFHPPAQSGSGSYVLIGGTLVDTQPLAQVLFYGDGTCTPFRAQIRQAGGAHMLSVDPWTCAPVLSKSDAAQ